MPRFATQTIQRSDALAQLMLLISRPELSPEQATRARHLVDQVTDWSEYLTLAHKNASLPFLYHHDRKHGLLEHLPDVSSVLRFLAMRSVTAAARMRKSLTLFHRSCIAPSSAAHVYVKGPALAARYYPEPGLRTCTDIDVLVGRRDFRKVSTAALESGYQFAMKYSPLTFAQAKPDIEFIVRHAEVISAFDEQSSHIEIHRQLEKTTPIFPDTELLATSEEINVDGCKLSTLSTAWHFCYAVYHHSRHFWSQLHWVADLHAMISHESFNKSEVLMLARKIGIEPSVAAALRFAELTSRPDLWQNELEKTPAGVFLDACLRGLPGDHSFELESWDAMFLFDFGDEWQFDSRRKFLFWGRSALRRLRPTVTQYLEHRRPRALEWLYVLENMRTLARSAARRINSE